MMVFESQLFTDIVSVVIDGFAGDSQNVGDFFGCVPVFHEIRYPDLLRGEIETGLGYLVQER